ncbi:MAG TPA: acylphosphatase [Dehalococcoidia bacterium]|nr:acylphosphatase [Dehalococcoidia bacterium]
MSDQELRAIRATVRGRVQGVGFRDFVLRRARTLKLRGWVRNGDDGRSVEVWAEGDEDALQTFRADLARGPALARVDEVEVTPAAPEGASQFQVRY